jgi:predicted amidohydrolase YtcJ
MPADLILKNANIWTVDDACPRASALAIRGREIVHVGSDAGARAWSGPGTRELDLRGQLVLPGFNDCHTHFVNAALRFATNFDLYQVTDLAEIQRRLGRFSEEHPHNDWLHGMRWFPTRMTRAADGAIGDWPTRADLDAVEARRPVVIFDIDGHSCWTNTAAIERMGYSASTPDPEGGQILRDGAGFPSGIFFEVAQEAFNRYPPVTGAEFPPLFQAEVARLNRLGLTSISNNGIRPAYLDAIQAMDADGSLHVRINEWVSILDGFEQALELRARFSSSEKIRMGTVKAFMDGVASNYSAWMLEPFADKPGETGYPVIDPQKLEALVIEADRLGFQVATHVIGTRAVRAMLDMYARAASLNGARDSRHRLEHVECSHPDDRKRFAELGVVSSMTPVHCTADLEGYYISRLGADGHLGFPWRSFLQNGVHLAFGTDWPAVDLREPAPLQQIFAAVTRCTPENYGRLEWQPDQRISVQEAIRSCTLEGAYAEKMEHRKGSLTPGKLADVIVLSENILEAPPEKILAASVLMTIFDGEIVHAQEQF